MALLFGSLAQADESLRFRFLGLALLVSRVRHGLGSIQQDDRNRRPPTQPANVDAHRRVTLLRSSKRRGRKASAHHVEGRWEGVAIRELLTRAGVPEGEALRGRALSSAVVVTGADGYRAVFGIAEFDPAFTDRVAILADRKDDAPLPANAAPFQLVITSE
jgi:hypothetical protein